MGTAVVLSGLVFAGCDVGKSATPAPTTDPSESADVAEVGDRPTHPPAPVEGMDPRPPKPTVIAAGLTARGDPFELVIQGTSKGTCILMTFPASGGEGGGRCGDDPFLDLSGPIQSTGVSTSGKGLQVDGLVGPAVDSVELSYERDGEMQQLQAVTEQISPGLLREVGETEPVGVFVAFLPPGVAVSDVTATALDADGMPLGTTRWAEL